MTLIFFPVKAEYVYFSNLKKGVFFWSFFQALFKFEIEIVILKMIFLHQIETQK